MQRYYGIAELAHPGKILRLLADSIRARNTQLQAGKGDIFSPEVFGEETTDAEFQHADAVMKPYTLCPEDVDSAALLFEQPELTQSDVQAARALHAHLERMLADVEQHRESILSAIRQNAVLARIDLRPHLKDPDDE